jgi:dehydrodolichyl diphosphate syntase complex subunit NUS1
VQVLAFLYSASTKRQVSSSPLHIYSTTNKSSIGILKRCIPQVHSDISLTLNSYFPYPQRPLLSLRAPNEQAFSPPVTPPDAAASQSQITVLLISEDDGRSTLVDLTKVLTTMAQKNKIKPGDINAEVIDSELEESVMGEPELLVLFGPGVKLDGYPPWQVRLTEIL